MKQAQMEMVGLVIIVILITLGMLFLAQFALKDDPQKKIFTRKGLAYSTVSALMKTTIDDPHCTVGTIGGRLPKVGEDLLEDCAVNYDNPGYSLYTCGKEHSCAFLNEQVTALLEQTLGQWHKRYEFRSELVKPDGSIEVLVGPVGSGCPKSKDRDSSEFFFLNTDAGLVESVLYVCD